MSQSRDWPFHSALQFPCPDHELSVSFRSLYVFECLQSSRSCISPQFITHVYIYILRSVRMHFMFILVSVFPTIFFISLQVFCWKTELHSLEFENCVTVGRSACSSVLHALFTLATELGDLLRLRFYSCGRQKRGPQRCLPQNHLSWQQGLCKFA